MDNYVILSEKPWNADLCDTLVKSQPNKNFFLINQKEAFNIGKLKEIRPKKIFVPHWSHIIAKEIYDNYECVVFHMTDLPFGRGGSPLQNLIVLGLVETKISALRVVKELDAGPIYLKKPLSLYGTAEEIFLRANEAIAEMISEILSDDLIPQKQEGEITLFKRRNPSMGNIDGLDELKTLYDQIRMLDADGYPKAFLENNNFRFEFTRASLKADKSIIADVRITKK